MPNQYQPTTYYDWNSRTHGVHLNSGNYQYVPYDYYAGDELHIQNVVFRESQYVTFDNTHIRFLNKSDIHVYDTSSLVIHDSGTLSMYTSANTNARKFVVDEYGRVGIGLDHADPVSNKGESPSFDLDVRGQVGVEDYIYHNDNTSTYLLFGSDRDEHNVNTNGDINTIYPSDNNEINIFTGDIAMLQMKTRNSIDLKITCPSAILDGDGPHAHGNPVEEQVRFIIITTLGTILIVLTDNILLDGKYIDANFPDLGVTVYIDTTLTQREQYIQLHERVRDIWNNAPANSDFTFDVSPIGVMEHHIVNDSSILEVIAAPGYPANGAYQLVNVVTLTESQHPGAVTYDLGGFDQVDHLTVNKYQSDVNVNIRSRTNKGAIVSKGDGTEVVINSDGNSDTDFRVSSEREPQMLFVDTSHNRVSIGDSEDTPQSTLEVTNHHQFGANGVPLVQLNNKDTDKQLLDINADNIDADVISVSADELVSADVISLTADSLETGDVLNATADSLTTGSLIHMTHTGSDKSEVSLVHFESTGDRGDDTNQTVLLDLNFDTTDGTGARALRIDSEQTTGIVVEIDAKQMTTGKGIELGLDSRTTGTGVHVVDTHGSDDAGALVKIEQTGDRSGTASSVGLDINFDTTDNANARALRIDSEQTTGTVVQIDADQLTTGEVVRVDADDITTGCMLHLESNSSSSSIRSLFRLNNDHTSATKTTLAHFRNDAIATDIQTVLIESTAAETNPLLELRNSNAAHDTPALLNFKRSHTNEEHDMDLGTITFEGTDSGDIDTVYAAISAQSTDKDNTNEAGQLSFMIQATDSPSQLRNVLSLGAQKNTSSTVVSTQAEVVINEDQIDIDFRVESNTTNNAFIVYGDGKEVVVNENGKADTDFRVEGDTTPNLLLVDTSEDHVKISGAANDDTDLFTVLGNSDTNTIGANLFKINPTEIVVNESGNDVNFRVESNDSIAFAADGHPGQLTHTKTHALFVDTSTGGVGLGTATPDATLHVVGDTHIEGDLWIKGETNQIDTLVHVTSAMDIINQGTGPALTVTQTGVQKVATFMDDTVPALVIEDGGTGRSGFVGLGLADPTRNLHVHRLGDETDDHAYAQFTTGDTGAGIGDGLHVGYDASEKAIINNKEETDLILKTNNTTALTVSGDGQHVAIGANGHTYTTLYVEATDGLRVPIGTVAQRPLPSAFDITITGDDYNNFASGTSESAPMLGTIRYNTEHSTFEGFGAGNQWGSLGGVIDVDRDTYWTAVNDLNNLHDLGAEKEGTDEFDPNTNYPGDVDYLRAFTKGFKRFAISDTGVSNWYMKTGGTGTSASPYTYTTYLQIEPNKDSNSAYDGTTIKSTDKNMEIQALGTDGTMLLSATKEIDITAGTDVDINATGECTIDAAGISLDSSAASSFTTTAGSNLTLNAAAVLDLTGNTVDINATAACTIDAGSTSAITLTSKTVKITNHDASTKGLQLGSTLVTATGAELNILDGSATDQATVTLQGSDGVVISDGDVMDQCLVSDFTTYLEDDITNLSNLVEVGALNAGSITSGFGAINNGGDGITTSGALAGGAITGTSATLGTMGTLDSSLAGTSFVLSVGGNVRADGDLVAYATSDARLKDNVELISDPIDKINKIGGYHFDWNDKSQYTGRDVGVLAQEVEDILPEVVTTRDNGDKAVNYEKMIPLLIECIKSQQKQIDELKENIGE